MNGRGLLAIVVLAGCAAPPSAGQSVEGPVSGLVWDAAVRRLRPVLGLPGASLAGAPIESGALAEAAASPDGAFAVALAGETRAAVLLTWQRGIEVKPLRGVRAGAVRIAMSPRGSAAAFYFADAGTVQVVRDLPAGEAPVEIPLAALGGAPRDLLVSDDGALVACLEAGGEGAAVIFGPAGELNRIRLASPVATAAFLPGGRDLLLTAGRQVALLKDAATGDRIDLADALFPPAAAALAGNRAILAASGRIEIRTLERGGEAPVQLDCDGPIEGLVPMNGGAAYRLNAYSNAPLRMLDLSGVGPRIVTVPPAAPQP